MSRVLGALASPVLTPRYSRAFEVAREVHARQPRKGSTIPYLTHVMAVSGLALENGADEDVAIAALLHDAVEDSDDGEAMEARIRSEFGARVAGIVLACSDRVAAPDGTKPEWHLRKRRYIAQLGEAGDDAILVSLCDKLHNLRSIVADHRAVGAALWDRFTTASRDDQVWYYTTLATLYATRRPGPLSDALGRLLAELEAAPDEAS